MYTSEIFFSIIGKYFILKDERNHAHQDIGKFETATELQECLLAALDEIESVMKS